MSNIKSRGIAVIITAVSLSLSLMVCGCQENKKAKSLINLHGEMPVRLSCIAAINQPDGSKYYTQQQQLLYVKQRAILFSASEPEGNFKWMAANDNYTGPKSRKLPARSKLMFSKEISLGILGLYFADSHQLSNTDVSQQASININGQLYRKAVRLGSEITLFANRQSGKIDTAKTTSQPSYIMQGYNYYKISTSGISIPTRIDVFELLPGQNKKFAARFSIFID